MAGPLKLAGALLGLVLAAGCRLSLNDYLVEARRGDTESLREATLSLGEILAEKDALGLAFDEGDRQAIEFLKAVAAEGRDLKARLYAISALAGLSRLDFSDLFLEALEDEVWSVRWEAAKALEARPVAQAAAPLAARLEVEPEPLVRLQAIRALGQIGNRTALECLLRVFLDRSGRYQDNRLKAYDLVTKLSGRRYPYVEEQAWQEYYAEEFAAGKEANEAPVEGGEGRHEVRGEEPPGTDASGAAGEREGAGPRQEEAP